METIEQELVKNGVRKYPTYEANPFLSGLVVQTRNATVGVSKKKLKLTDVITDEPADEIALLAIKKEVDTNTFVKIYLSTLQAFFNLSARALRVYIYILLQTRMNEDKIIFDIDECMKETEYKNKSSVYDAIEELLEHEFIARTKAFNIYYLNPNLAFNGDRLVIVKEYTRKKDNKNTDLKDYMKMGLVPKNSKAVRKEKE